MDRRIAIMDEISNIRKLTYDPALRQLLVEVEYERAELELRAEQEYAANNLYQSIVARMSLARNRLTHNELVGLAEVEQMGWTNDPCRRNVDIACSERAATGYGLNFDRSSNGPRPGETVTSLFKEPGWTVASSRCTDAGCSECRPVSPETTGMDSTGASGRWSQRMAERAARAA